MHADDLDELAGRTVRVRCADCRLVLGAIQSNGSAFGLRPVDEVERAAPVVERAGFRERPAFAHVRQDVYEHADGAVSVTWVHTCGEGRRRRQRSTQRRLDRLALAWTNAARAGDDLPLEP